MAELPYMPWYPSDYGADTKHLTLEEHGAYRLLLDELWLKGGALRFDEKRLAKRLSVTPHRFRKIWSEIGEFFCLAGGEISNKRVTEELEKARKNIEKRTEVARQAAQKRWKKDKKNSGRSMPEAMPTQCQPEPEGSGRTLTGSTMNLTPDGALALGELRAACVTEHTRDEVSKLESCITGWRDGVILVDGPYAVKRFSEKLAGELRHVGVTLANGKARPAEQPQLKAIDGGKKDV